ncbi:Uncharacterised protein [Enterobacter cloacae]|uniref:Uncharacterized protein n=1 Tax=Enterobacter genomosp. O TaxID=2364150 RepID=A0A0X4ED55_9ENTR|nr:hypothetical protein ABR39_03645 [Enterobacter genomosp. O]KUQ79640.1 hypothetical protein AWI28_05240 [Enterobacter genomosp. O]KZQ31798.1 hypothetical protein A3464_21555 [Enterobacter genomosp. O]SAE60078.1 Uncharacterised protein [Enterobacter cloacae]
MRGFIKSIFKLILEDLKNDLKAYATIFVIVILSMIPVTFIEDDQTAMLIVGAIVVIVFYIAYFYEPKG